MTWCKAKLVLLIFALVTLLYVYLAYLTRVPAIYRGHPRTHQLGEGLLDYHTLANGCFIQTNTLQDILRNITGTHAKVSLGGPSIEFETPITKDLKQNDYGNLGGMSDTHYVRSTNHNIQTRIQNYKKDTLYSITHKHTKNAILRPSKDTHIKRNRHLGDVTMKQPLRLYGDSYRTNHIQQNNTRTSDNNDKIQKIPSFVKKPNKLNDFEVYHLSSCKAVCEAMKGKFVYLLILVSSSPFAFKDRQMTRKTWGSITSVSGKRIETIFIVGMVKHAPVQKNLALEMGIHGDIIQAEFQDSYHNLTLKTVLGVKWATENCPNVHFIMKTDHDTYITMSNLINFLSKLKENDYFYIGYTLKNTKVIRPGQTNNAKLKRWEVSFVDYPYTHYPDYCAGAGYVLSRKAAKEVVKQAQYVKMFGIEDAFIGVCADLCGIEALHGLGFSSYWSLYTPCRARYHITSHFNTHKDIENIWSFNTTLANDSHCPPKLYLDIYYNQDDESVMGKYKNRSLSNPAEVKKLLRARMYNSND